MRDAGNDVAKGGGKMRDAGNDVAKGGGKMRDAGNEVGPHPLPHTGQSFCPQSTGLRLYRRLRDTRLHTPNMI